MTEEQARECEKVVGWCGDNLERFPKRTQMGKVFPLCLTAVMPVEIHETVVGRIIMAMSGYSFNL